MMRILSCLTYNVNGINDSGKRREVFYYLHKKDYDIVFMQETHSEKKKEKIWTAEFGNKIWFAHGESNARGGYNYDYQKVKFDCSQCYYQPTGTIFVTVCYYDGEKKRVLVNVYAPNKDDPNFFQDPFTEISRFGPQYTIVAGDMNLALDIEVDRLGSICNNDRAAKILQNLIDREGLVDGWRYSYPDQNGFTFIKSEPKLICSRLDYFFLSGNVIQFNNKLKVIPGFRTDHSTVLLELDFCEEK